MKKLFITLVFIALPFAALAQDSRIDNLVFEQTNTTGTGNATLTSVTGGYQSFSAAFSTGSSNGFFYCITHQTASEYECGEGYMSDSTTLVRNTVHKSSNSDALVNFTAGTKDVFNDVLAEFQAVLNASGQILASNVFFDDNGTITSDTVQLAIEELDKALTDDHTEAITGNLTLTADEFTDNVFIDLTGAMGAGFTLSLPARNPTTTNTNFTGGGLESITGWTCDSGATCTFQSGTVAGANAGPSGAFEGTNYVYLKEAASFTEIRSDNFDLTAVSGFSTTNVDNGDVFVQVTVRQNNITFGSTTDSGRFVVHARDSGGSLISTIHTASYDNSSAGTWQLRDSGEVLLPATTRQLSVDLECDLTAFTNCDIAFDDVIVQLHDYAVGGALNKGLAVIRNNAGDTATVDVSGESGATVTIPDGETKLIYSDGVNVYDAHSLIATEIDIAGLTAVDPLDVDADTVAVDDAGTTKKATIETVLEATNDLTEDTTSVSGDKYLKITGGQANWIDHDNMPGGGSASALNDLTDVDTATNGNTQNDILVFDGTNYVPTDPIHASNPFDWTLLDVQVASAVTQVDLGFDGDIYDSVWVEIIDADSASNEVDLILEVTDDSFVSVETGASSYSYNYERRSHATSPAGSEDGDDAHSNIILMDNLGDQANELFTVDLFLKAPGSSEQKKFNWRGTGLRSDAAAYRLTGSGMFIGNTNTLKGVRLRAETGNISGTFKLWARKKVTSVPDLNILAQSPDFEVIDVQEASTSTSIDFTFDPDIWSELQLTVYDYLPATDATGPYIRFSTDGGSSFASGASDYRWALDAHDSSDPADRDSGTNTDGEIVLSGAVSNVSTEPSFYRISLLSLASGTHARASWVASMHDSDNDDYVVTGSGRYEGATTAVNAVRMASASGNIASGTFVLRGRRKVTAAPITGGERRNIKVEDLSAASSFDCGPFDPDLYEFVRIDFRNIVPSGDNTTLNARVGTGATPTYQSGASDYSWSIYDVRSSNSTVNGTNDDSDSEFSVVGGMGTGTGENAAGHVILEAPDSSNYKVMRASVSTYDHTPDNRRASSSGTYLATTQITGLQILPASGTFSGRAVCWGELKVQ